MDGNYQGAQALYEAARNHGRAAALDMAQLYKTDRLPEAAADLAAALVNTAGPELDDELVALAVLSIVARVEAVARADKSGAAALLPDNLTEAAAQINAAVALLVELTSLPGGAAYLESVRDEYAAREMPLNNDQDGETK